ncbi:hypothetical protein DEU56DRAFT_820683 [Suillus clintonianus]|uniref:uncharacterized protein n=1 Tax=Suillus clintonianus TaxID=1904413 RepID=UPI001B884CB8|nr:uncharacterized protein DEU56DRAFT_820683 [Suillus clintonianus]KAG2127212.1 hypothetical protein DEU56DRAFT_820683 [Suillus clintonianus]
MCFTSIFSPVTLPPPLMLVFCTRLLLRLASRPRPLLLLRLDILSHNCVMHHRFPTHGLAFSSANSFICTLRQGLVSV